MLRLSSVLCLLVAFAAASAAQAQDFGGHYVMELEGDRMTLDLSQDASGAVAGQLNATNAAFRLEGGLQAPGIGGLMISDAGAGTFGFLAELQDQNRQLMLQVIPIDENDVPAYDYAETLVFVRQGAAPAGQSAATGQAEGNLDQGQRNVWVNRARLPDQTVQQFETQFGTPLPDGRYWYDALCGAWGLEGGPTAGFMLANLNLPGPMPADISGGGTRI